jgi:hypothetical protein
MFLISYDVPEKQSEGSEVILSESGFNFYHIRSDFSNFRIRVWIFKKSSDTVLQEIVAQLRPKNTIMSMFLDS